VNVNPTVDVDLDVPSLSNGDVPATVAESA